MIEEPISGGFIFLLTFISFAPFVFFEEKISVFEYIKYAIFAFLIGTTFGLFLGMLREGSF